MTKTSKKTTIAGRLSVWKIAAVASLVAAAMGAAGAQSTLRFVGPLEDTMSPAVQSNGEASASVATNVPTQAKIGSDVIVLSSPKRPATTEFRFLDASMDVAAAKTEVTEAKTAKSAAEFASTLTLSKVNDQQIPTTTQSPVNNTKDSLEFRFVDAATGATAAKMQSADVVKSARPTAPVRPKALDLAKTAFSDGLIAVPAATTPAAPAAEVKSTPAPQSARIATAQPKPQTSQPVPSKSLLVASKPSVASSPAADLSASLSKAGQDAVALSAQVKNPRPAVSPFATSLPSAVEPIIADNPPQLNIPTLPVVEASKPSSELAAQESPKQEPVRIALSFPTKGAPVEIVPASAPKAPVATPQVVAVAPPVAVVAPPQVAAATPPQVAVVAPQVGAVAPPQVRDLAGDLTQANSAALVASRPQLPSALKSQFALTTKEQPVPSMSANETEEAKLVRDFSAKLIATPNDIYSRQSTLNSPSFSYLAAADDVKSSEKASATPPIPTPPSQPPAVLAGDSKPEPNRDTMGGMHPVYGGPESGSCRCGCPYGPCQSGAQSICGVDCGSCGAPCSATWKDTHCIPWSMFGPGEYVGPARSEHVSTYYLRVNDLLTLTYITSRKKIAESYRIGVGDKLQIEWLKIASTTDVPLNRELLVQPDGTVSLPLIGEVPAAGKTIKDFQDEITNLFAKYQREPQITVTPLDVNVGLRDVINAVTSVSGSNGQSQALRVTPEGTIQAPGLGSVYAQGLTLDELRSELEARYATTFGPGLLVSPSLTERATSYVFMGGEVRTPGRYTLEGPTTVMQAITLAGGWNNGGNLHQVVVFRRDENWCLKATKIDVRAPFYGHDPCPVNDVWLRDNDLVIVPKERILCAADVIELYFTRGVYAVFPITFVKDFSTGSAITPIP